MLGHKTSPPKFKKTEILSSIFSNHSSMRLENWEQELQKQKHVEAEQRAAERQMGHQRGENTWSQMDMETMILKSTRRCKGSSEREVYSDTSLPWETRKSQILSHKNTKSKRYMHLYVHCSIIYHSQEMEAT